MSKKEVKRIFRIFTISDYDKEEEFLQEQHKEGFKCIKYKFPGFYYFEKCEPEEVVYQLDFNDVKKSSREEYLQLYQDAGWEYVYEVNGWNCFRKPVSLEEETPAIFTDRESKIALVDKVVKERMLPLLAIFLCCLLPNIGYACFWLSEGGLDRIFRICYCVIFYPLFLYYLWVFLHCGRNLQRLKKDYENGVK